MTFSFREFLLESWHDNWLYDQLKDKYAVSRAPSGNLLVTIAEVEGVWRWAPDPWRVEVNLKQGADGFVETVMTCIIGQNLDHDELVLERLNRRILNRDKQGNAMPSFELFVQSEMSYVTPRMPAYQLAAILGGALWEKLMLSVHLIGELTPKKMTQLLTYDPAAWNQLLSGIPKKYISASIVDKFRLELLSNDADEIGMPDDV